LPTPEDLQPDFLTAACAAARWIVSRQSGSHWASRPDESIEDQIDFYYGNAGTILFFRELAESTGEPGYQEIAFNGAIYMAAQMEKVTYCGFFHGLAGMAFALDQLMRTSEDRSLLGPLNRAIEQLQIHVQQGHSTLRSDESNDLASGLAGIGLVLLHLAKESGKSGLLESAKVAGDRLITLAQNSPNGIYWTLSEASTLEYPNFSHGTAGIGYFLAALFEATKDERYLGRALAAGAYLRSIISKAPSSNCLVPHDQTTGRSLFYLGWCHGPAGTGRFFFRLYQLADEPAWLDLVTQQAVTLQDSGIPERQTLGYWNNVSRCCGAAGVGEFFLGLYTATKEKTYLTFAQRIAVYLISRAERVEDGMKWTQSETRLEPDYLLAQTGLMQGAAGIGLFLVHVAQISQHQKPLIRFPDEPQWENNQLPTPP
jgi:lantibiotic modifying enzyme